MSLLTIVQDSCYVIGITAPTAVVTSSDATILELLAMANRVGNELSRRYEWQELTKQASWSATGSIDQGYLTSIDTSFGRFIDQTMWDRTLRQNIIGPVTAQEWQSDLSWAVVSPPYKFIVQSGKLQVGPTAITAAHTMVFNFISKYWCQSSVGAGQSAFAADTDTAIIPEELFTLSLIWRWKQAKGLAYAEDMESAEEQIERYMGQSGGRRVLFVGGSGIYYLGENVPAGDWPSVP